MIRIALLVFLDNVLHTHQHHAAQAWIEGVLVCEIMVLWYGEAFQTLIYDILEQLTVLKLGRHLVPWSHYSIEVMFPGQGEEKFWFHCIAHHLLPEEKNVCRAPVLAPGLMDYAPRESRPDQNLQGRHLSLVKILTVLSNTITPCKHI